MKVLSLFDGMACGLVALKRAGIFVSEYYTSEIDKYAASVARLHHPELIELGDVRDITTESMPIDIDLIIGGSPCQGFSFAGKKLNFDDPRSALFFEYLRLLDQIKPRYFLLENVMMKKAVMEKISELLKVQPIMINSSLVSAQHRKRLYWTNIPNVTQPNDKGIMMDDMLECGFSDRKKSYCIDANYAKSGDLFSYFEKHSRQLVFSKNGLCHLGNADIKGNDHLKRVYHRDGKSPTINTCTGGHRIPKVEYKKNIWRPLLPVECERLQTLPDGYTEFGINSDGKKVKISKSQRLKMIGNGWTVDVLAHIFSHIAFL